MGPSAVLTSCTVGNHATIGEGAIIEAGSDVGATAIVAPGSVVVRNTVIPSGQFWAGNPAKYVREVTEEELSQQKTVRY